MKQFFVCLTALAASTFFSCNQPATDKPGDHDAMMSGDNDHKRAKESMDMVYRAIESGNFDGGADSLFADDVTDHYMKETKGKDSVLAMLKSMHTMIKDLKFENKGTAYDPDNQTIYTMVHMTGTALTADMGMKPGQAMDMTSIDVVKLNNWKATDHWAFDDCAAMMASMAPPHQ